MESPVVFRYTPEQFNAMYKVMFGLGAGAFGAVAAAMEPKKDRPVTIKRIFDSKPIHRDTEYIAMRKLAEGHCQFVPAFLKAFKIGYDSTCFVFNYEEVKDLKAAWK